MPARVTPPGAPPRPVREVENAWIPLADGTRLAARLWLPEDAAEAPVPAILEYIPYCKRDGTAARDEAMHPYFAAHGYAAVRVDLRGSGESDGLLDDEYLARELDDGLEVIAWIARQPWCGGRVGMIGKSWGGFNALQVAALRPPALACIITVDSTDDRYADDVHYMGGCLNVSNLTWAFSMFGRNARPPDPAIVGERWREMWRTRLENNRPWVVDWLRHQRRDAYWQHGSVCQDYGAIVCPVYAIGGWADAYSNAVPRLIAGQTCPRKALIGPWGHQYPHQGSPGPAIGFLQEALRWWDHWLNDRDSGIMDEPVVRVWMQDYGPPRTFQSTRPGRWITAAGWPPESVDAEAYALNPRGLHREAAPRQDLTLASPQTLGAGCISWINSGAQGALEEPSDQREDDAQSLAFDSAPLEDAIEILGAPVVELDLTADRPNALVCARLCEVAPNGASTRVSYGLLNLTHRDGHADPTPLRPGETLRARVRLNDIAHRFSAGHRIRARGLPFPPPTNGHWPIASGASPEAARRPRSNQVAPNGQHSPPCQLGRSCGNAQDGDRRGRPRLGVTCQPLTRTRAIDDPQRRQHPDLAGPPPRPGRGGTAGLPAAGKRAFGAAHHPQAGPTASRHDRTGHGQRPRHRASGDRRRQAAHRQPRLGARLAHDPHARHRAGRSPVGAGRLRLDPGVRPRRRPSGAHRGDDQLDRGPRAVPRRSRVTGLRGRAPGLLPHLARGGAARPGVRRAARPR